MFDGARKRFCHANRVFVHIFRHLSVYRGSLERAKNILPMCGRVQFRPPGCRRHKLQTALLGKCADVEEQILVVVVGGHVVCGVVVGGCVTVASSPVGNLRTHKLGGTCVCVLDVLASWKQQQQQVLDKRMTSVCYAHFAEVQTDTRMCSDKQTT